MALKTRVLVSGIHNLGDARYCAGMGVEFMGFNFNSNDPESFSKDNYKEIVGWISGVSFVGKFGESDPSYIIDVAEQLDLDYIEVDKTSILPHFKYLNIPLILKIDISQIQDWAELGKILNDYEHYVSFFNLYTTNEISEEYWIKITEYMMSYPIILGFNITLQNINHLIETTKLDVISIKIGHNSKYGLKSFDELAEILEAIEIDDTL
ncbi:MAG: hypothetical protein M3421_01335 [Bacteroidota bacterium]|jgi:phosphoribosylanthranilate isomerase|nr:hypothetical protein [Bacteroidota bacterium]